MRRIAWTAAGLALAVLAALAPATAQAGKTATAQTTTPATNLFDSVPPKIRAEMLAQRPAAQAAHDIRMAVETQGYPGLAGIAIKGTALEVWWKGDLPPKLRKLIDSITGVKIIVRKAAYSQAELEKAAAKLEADMRDNPDTLLHSVRYLADGSGVAVSTEVEADKVRETLTRLAGPLPVQVIIAPRWELHTGRMTDTMNFWGGGRILNISQGLGCSAGFAVAGGAGMLTAGHCGDIGNEFRNGDHTVTYGWARRKRASHDLMLIPTNAAGRIYVGGVDIPKTHNMSMAVAGWDWAWPGELICHSGATSGTVCGIRNTDTYALSFCAAPFRGRTSCFSDMIVSHTLTHGNPSQRGDSGGPVFTFAPTATREVRVIAKGTITGGGYGDMIYQDFGTAWRDFGVTPAIDSQ
ncbi:hypothetical protein [Nonomuraea jabiensis]|uniref:hypothetical protein n=1 Tax=Nonomuraea jabiensis TaxID=882448 RepID=UPI003D76213F